MKQIIILLVISFILMNCKRKKTIDSQIELKTEITESKEIKDTVYNYWALILDTVSNKKHFKVSQLKHTLELKTYSLNDSSVVRQLELIDDQIFLDHGHKIVTDLKLYTGSTIDFKQIDKTNFKSDLDSDFYEFCNLNSTVIDTIMDNTIHMTSDLVIPDTDNQYRIWYSIKISDKKLEGIKIQKTDFVGL